MDVLKRTAPIDLGPFTGPEDKLVAKYGLPHEILFCRECVISNQRPNSAREYDHTADTKKATIAFDEYSVCDACRAAKQKNDVIDWKEREAKLVELCDLH